jgi:hypothetical protein
MMSTTAHARSALAIGRYLFVSLACWQFIRAAVAAQAAPEPPSPVQAVGPQSSAVAAARGDAVAPAATPLQPLAQAIAVEPGATCLQVEKLVRRVARWLQRELIDARIRIEVHGDRTQKNRVAFEIDRSGGERAERTISDAPEDCDQFHAALALSIALAIDASSQDSGLDRLRREELPSDEELLAKPEKPEPPYLRLGMALFGHATAGLLTDTSSAASARLEVGFLRWLDLRLGALGTQVDGQPLRPPAVDGTFYAGLLVGRFDACAVWPVSDGLRALACVGAAAGSLRTRGHHFATERTQNRLWSGALGGIEAQAQLLSWFALAASVDLTVPLARHRIQALGPHGELVGERLLTSVAVLIGVGPVFRFF